MSVLKKLRIGGFGALLLALGTAGVSAQEQVDTQVNTQVPGPPPAARNYGPQQFELLPSERLMAFQRSGMLPSEYRMNLEAVGPLAPQGALDIIEPQSLLQRELRLPPPILFNPAYVAPLPANANAPEPPPPLSPSDNLYLRRPAAERSASSLSPAPIDRNVWRSIPSQETTTTYYLPKNSSHSSIAPAHTRQSAGGSSTRPAAKAQAK